MINPSFLKKKRNETPRKEKTSRKPLTLTSNVRFRIHNIRCILLEAIFKERVCLGVSMLIFKEPFGAFHVNSVTQ